VANQVTLTFGGDPTGAKKAFGEVGDAAKRMQGDVEHSADGFKRAGEAADEVDTKAMGFRDTLTGVQDTMKGVSMLAKGPSFDAFLTLGAGIGDLGSGFYNFLIPALHKTKIATLASAGASKAAALGANIWNGAQKLLNISLLTSPLTWIVLAIAAIVAIIILIATKTHWFQNIWRVAWSGIKSAASNTWEFLKKIPGWIQSAFSKVGGFILAPYKAAFNGIARAWNNTVGRLSWSVPGWVPFIGGNTISVPHLPTFHSGGIVPGIAGTPTPILALAGERIGSMASGSGATVTVRAGDGVMRALVDAVAAEVRSRGGDAAQLGIRLA
jgi:hypothetical protein